MAGRYRKIVVPLDGSPLAERAIPHALDVARDNGDAEVILLSVLAAPAHDLPDPLALSRSSAQAAEAREQVSQYLARVQTEYADDECACSLRSEIIEGTPVPALICGYCKENGVNLIVMSTHGRTGLSRLLFGSVARDVMEGIDVPVLLVQPDKA
jgi:nucleotide-binding universal stress UspA family protein